jgi:TolA-binding protein
MKSTVTASAELGSLREQVDSLNASLEELRRQTAEQSKTIAELTARFSEAASLQATAASPAQAPGKPEHPSVTPEIMSMIAAAVTEFLGKKVRIRSARMLQSPYEVINPWAQQGRVSIQASHILAMGRMRRES